MAHLSRKQRKLRQRLITSASILVLVLLCGVLLFFYKPPGSGSVADNSRGKTIYHDDVAYFPRQDVQTFLLLGVDKLSPVTSNMPVGSTTTAEVAILFIFDDAKAEYTVITFNPDTITDIPMIDAEGRLSETAMSQLSLAYAYGDGQQESCLNSVNTVSNLIFGAPIDWYLSVELDGIRVLNDAVGGVTVDVVDDFSQIDETIKIGKVKLEGEQPLKFLQVRRGPKVKMSTTQLDRQKDYIKGFLKSLESSVSNGKFNVVKLHNKMRSQVISNCSNKALMTIVSRFGTYEIADIIAPDGNDVTEGDTTMHYVDTVQLKQMIIDLIYEPK